MVSLHNTTARGGSPCMSLVIRQKRGGGRSVGGGLWGGASCMIAVSNIAATGRWYVVNARLRASDQREYFKHATSIFLIYIYLL